ncbi:unnamed protein product [Parnassius apollo]|uniref:(apollo) hypothetical protein n=1 Tax=Parnassius apollo TaxID=110799 RepID=A0A8S3X545_PARAO|nr:unnamed protein product [Parnassius apollo]
MVRGKARMFCEKSKAPLEIGKWGHYLMHLDSAVVENSPVSTREGQVYVYENYFPGYVIKYVHVDNVAIKSCGASASIKQGGIGSSSILIVLHAATNEDIRTVIDIWGTKRQEKTKGPLQNPSSSKNFKSLYLFKDLRIVNHNNG